MTNIQQLESALIAADQAGDTESAQVIANEIKNFISTQQPQKSKYADMSAIDVAKQSYYSLPSDAKQLAKDSWEAIKSPETTLPAIGNLMLTGAAKLVDVTGLGKYASPQKMAKYRQAYGIMGPELQHLATLEGFKQRIAEKPLTSLLDISMVGQGVTLPIKATRFGGLLNTSFKTIDPTQIVTKLPAAVPFFLPKQYSFADVYEKISDIAQTKASQYAPDLKKIQSYIKSGFVIPPSEVKGTGIFKKGLEYFLGETTVAKASVKNQQVINSKIRIFLDVPENTPLSSAMQIIKDRTQPIYNEVAKIKPILVSKSQTIPQTRLDSMRVPIDMPPKKIAAQKTRSGQQILNDIEKQRATTSKAYRDATDEANRLQQTPDYAKADKSLAKQHKFESELERLTDLSGNPALAAQLKEARIARAKGHSIENAINKGDLDATLFAKQNKSRPVTAEGEEIIKFTQDYPNLVKQQPKRSFVPHTFAEIIQKAPLAAAYAVGGLAGGWGGLGTLLGARLIMPSLLASKPFQSGLGKSNFMPTGSGVLKALANQQAVSSSAYIPSLLQSSDSDLINYY